jgi:DNA-directed RNA polymerase subunit RPC12/RpoP
MRISKELEEQIIQKFLYRCPYCDQPISYEQIHLKIGENEIECSSCKRRYIKVVSDISPSPSSVKGEGKKGSLAKRRVVNHGE